MRKIAKQILVFSALLSLFIFTGKIFSKPSVNNDLGNEIATQVYYDHKLSWKNIFINVLLTSQRVKHELTEVGRDSTLSTEKVNYALKAIVTNNTSNTQTYSRTISVTTSATVSSKITAAFEVIEAEIGVSVSTSKTVSETIEVEIIPHTTVKIYGYVCNDVISNLEDKQTLQDRILFWWVDSGTETVCGTCKTYNAPGYEIIFINS